MFGSVVMEPVRFVGTGNDVLQQLHGHLAMAAWQTSEIVAETLTQAVKDSCAAANSMIGSTGNCDPSSVALRLRQWFNSIRMLITKRVRR